MMSILVWPRCFATFCHRNNLQALSEYSPVGRNKILNGNTSMETNELNTDNQNQSLSVEDTTTEKGDLFNACGLRVQLSERPGSFLAVKETLTRMGIPSRGNILSQSCHILHRRGQYAIVHFKEMFILNGRQSTFTDIDEARRDGIALALQSWGLVKLLDEPSTTPEQRMKAPFRVIKFGDKSKWTLNSKYTFSKRKTEEGEEHDPHSN